MKKLYGIFGFCAWITGFGWTDAHTFDRTPTTHVPAASPVSVLHASASRTPADSLRVEQLLQQARTLPADSCRTLFFARQLIGTPYVAHTLDQGKEEVLVSRLDALDCTTFVETVVALTWAEQTGECSWEGFRRQLELLRYRDGKRQGYASRLHYFSDWIADNERKGRVRERTALLKQAMPAVLNLYFMTTHADSYPRLRHQPSEVKKLEQVEQVWKDRPVSYIPKAQLNASADELDIRNGDILTLTTSIAGLDVVHVGFALWVNGRLHLLHASSTRKQVVVDAQPLYDYLRPKKAHTGIRVVSVAGQVP